MKKFLTLLLAAMMVFTLTACGKTGGEEGGDKVVDENHYDVVFLADLGSIYDGGFNEYSFAGISQYCDEKGLKYTYLQPAGQTDADRVSIFQQAAVQMTADVVVAVGYLWDSALVQEIPNYPELKVIFVDADDLYTVDLDWDGVSDGIEKQENLAMICFHEQDSGYQAGYAAVLDGYRKLAFFGGMAVPAVVRFGYGFVEGAEAAAKDLGLEENSIEMKYYYTGTFDASPDLVTYVANWYTEGTEVVFSCGGLIVNSVLQAAKDTGNGKVIGVDADEYFTRAGEGQENEPLIITSAMKSLQNTIYNALVAAYQGGDAWGKYTAGLIKLGAAEDAAVIAPYRAENWTNLTQEDYDMIRQKAVEAHATLLTDVDGANGAPVVDNLKYVKVTYFEK